MAECEQLMADALYCTLGDGHSGACSHIGKSIPARASVDGVARLRHEIGEDLIGLQTQIAALEDRIERGAAMTDTGPTLGWILRDQLGRIVATVLSTEPGVAYRMARLEATSMKPELAMEAVYMGRRGES